ncbi:MAG: hypothetical protein QOH39_976 [Verrucomicrobiota bacterium]|jgi:hypothetical protein
MTKGALWVVAGFFGLCFSLFAKPANHSNILSLNDASLRLPSLTLSDGQAFSFASTFNSLEPVPPDFLPVVSMPQPQLTAAFLYVTSGKDSSNDTKDHRSEKGVDVQRSNLLNNVHGEVGFLYGRSTGKFSRDVEQGYVISELGDDKFHMTVGAFYENSSTHFPRRGN